MSRELCSSPESLCAETKSPRLGLWIWGSIIVIVGWWIYDLHFHWLNRTEYQFGWIVALLAAYLIWEKYPVGTRSPASHLCNFPSNANIQLGGRAGARPYLLLGLGIPFVVIAELYKHAVGQTPTASLILSVGCIIFISSILLYSKGYSGWKHFIFPFLFLFLAVPLPGIIWSPIVSGLKDLVTGITIETLGWAGIEAVQQGNLIRLPDCVVGVDEACSGVRSLQSSVMASLFIGALTFKLMRWKLILFLFSVPLAILGNCIRSFWLSLTAHRHGVEALEQMHDAAGWAILAFTTMGLITASWTICKLEGRDALPRVPRKETNHVKFG